MRAALALANVTGIIAHRSLAREHIHSCKCSGAAFVPMLRLGGDASSEAHGARRIAIGRQ
jgi:hypothetical protein